MNPVQFILIALVKVYRWTLSPALVFCFGPMARCRFTPTCSEYALEALKKYGAFGGGWLAVKRLCRCQPWGGCGHDPVPGTGERTPKADERMIAGPAVRIEARQSN